MNGNYLTFHDRAVLFTQREQNRKPHGRKRWIVCNYRVWIMHANIILYYYIIQGKRMTLRQASATEIREEEMIQDLKTNLT